jgi:hypothetical protein
MWLEYEAADCHVEAAVEELGHIPPKTYMKVSEAFA